MPSGVFKPYAGVSTAALVFTKGEPTKKVWFYEMKADGYSLDDKRTFIDGKGDIPDILEKFNKRDNERFEDETGWKYVETYFPIMGFGDDAVEDWFEIPNWAALDTYMRKSLVSDEWTKKPWDFMDMTRATSSVVYRTAQDVKIPTPP
jgi:type I restriction-modification system DNA methylase subunit